jgi:hypothetical protein
MNYDINAHVEFVKNTMNRSEVLNELQRCVEVVTDEYHLPTEAWEVWFRGRHLGSIERKYKGCYAVFSSIGRHCGDCANFMQAISRFIDSAAVVIADKQIKETQQWINSVVKEPEIRRWGVTRKSRWFDKVKGWFK